MNTYAEIIQFAIECEVEAETYYFEVAAKTTKEITRSLFLDLAAEEKRHQQILKAFSKTGKTELHFKEVSDYKISESVDKVKLTDEMTLADVYNLAMKNEEAAMKMYQKLASDSVSEESRKLFDGLALMELGHKVKMEQYYSDVAYGEVW